MAPGRTQFENFRLLAKTGDDIETAAENAGVPTTQLVVDKATGVIDDFFGTLDALISMVKSRKSK